MRRTFRALLLVLAGVVGGYARSPSILSATFETREIGGSIEVAGGAEEHVQYHTALIRVKFDQPLFVNASVPLSSLAPTSNATTHVLYGATRLQCPEGRLFEGHPPLVPGTGVVDGIPTWLVPLNEPDTCPAHRLFAVFVAEDTGEESVGDTLLSLLHLEITRGDSTSTVTDVGALADCSFVVLPEAEQSWWPTARLTNAEGESAAGRAPLVEIEAEDTDAHAAALAREARLARRRAARMRAAARNPQEAGEGEAAAAAADADESAERAEAAARDASRGEYQLSALLEGVRGTHFSDSEKSVDTVDVYSFLETMHRVGTLEKVEAGQYFELIEDPLMNMMIPVMVGILTNASKQPIILALCKILEKLLPKILSAPIKDEMNMLEIGEGTGLSAEASALLMGHGAVSGARGVLSPGLDPRSRDVPHPRSADAVEAEAEAGLSASMLLARRRARLGALGEDADAVAAEQRAGVARFAEAESAEFRRTGREQGLRFSEAQAALTARGGSGCSTAATESQCMEYSEHKSREACSWCSRLSGSAMSYSCVRCKDMSRLTSQGFSCSPSEDECSPQEDAEEAPEKPEDPEAWGEEPEGTQLEEQIASSVVDNAVTQIARTSHARIAMSVLPVANSTIIRGASRALTQTLSVSLTQNLAISITSALAKVLTRVTTKEISMALTPTLTHAIVPIVAQSLSHRPKGDYYCFHCEKFKLYCENCHKVMVEDYYRDYYADYYAEYYGRYYGYYYGAVYADIIAGDVGRGIAKSSNPEEGTSPPTPTTTPPP